MTLAKIRFHHLRKQNLLKSAPSGDYHPLLQKHIALHSTDYLTPYFSLRARLDNFNPKELFEDLNHNKTVLRLRAFRGTVFVLDREVLSETIAAKKFYYAASKMGEAEKLSRRAGFDLAVFEKRINRLLEGRKALSTTEIKKGLSSEMDVASEFFPFALRYLEFTGVLCRGTQRHIADRTVKYALLKEWFPGLEELLSPEEAFDSLVHRYVSLFGPVTLEDLCWWFPVTKTMARDSLARLGKTIRSFSLDGRCLLMEETDYQRLQKLEPWKKGEDPVVTFLPYEDHFAKAFFGRDWFLSPEAVGLVMKKGTIYRGQLFPSIWLNGEIIGGWELSWVDKKKSAAVVRITGLVSRLKEDGKIGALIEEKRCDLERFIYRQIRPLM
jgi:hypothetical protein